MSKWWSCGSNQESNSIFRSEVMSLVQMYLQPEAAYDTIAALGEVGVVQFRDVSVWRKKRNHSGIPNYFEPLSSITPTI